MTTVRLIGGPRNGDSWDMVPVGVRLCFPPGDPAEKGGVYVLAAVHSMVGGPLVYRWRAPTTHMRFVGGTIYCSEKAGRINLGPEHRYGDSFACPYCGADVPAREASDA